MNWLSLSWLRRSIAKPNRRLPAKPKHRSRLTLETLEDRTVPTIFFVVPAGIPTDGGHFHDLASAIAVASQLGDTIQIEPGSVPGNASTGTKSLTLQGDLNYGPLALPQTGILNLQSDGNVLVNLNLGSVAIANGATGQIIRNSFAVNISELNGPLLNGSNVISYNTISNTVVMGSGGNIFPGAINDVIKNNVFINNAPSITLLAIAHDNGAVITGNILQDSAINVRGIQVEESTGVVVSNNTVVLTGTGTLGIQIDNPEFDVSASVTNNRVDTAGLGTGIITVKTPTHDLSVLLSGNDLVQNKIGIDVEGDGTSAGTVDAGGGVLNSRGGNDLHGYDTTVVGRFAIQTGNGSSGTVGAELNIFSVVNPGTVINAQGAGVNSGVQLSADQSFVQTLYNDVLHRSGELAHEIQGWVDLIPSAGRTAVASGIIHSSEAYSRLVERYHVKFFGRDATAAEVSAGVGALLGGATAEDLAANLVASDEFLAHTVSLVPTTADPTTNFATALYLVLLDRVPNPIEVTEKVKIITPTNRQAVALGVLLGSEFRTYAVNAMYFTDPAFATWSFFDIIPNLLHRQQPPNPIEPPIWVNSPLNLLDIESAIAGSGESYLLG